MSDRATQSIFAAIDSGSYNAAKVLCAQQLQKYPNSSYYYALSSYILLLNGERVESISKSRELMKKTPSDPSALEILNIVFRKAGLYKESIEIYENACKKYPNYSLIQSWFDLSVKNFDILSLQKSGMLLAQHSTAETSRDNKLRCSFNLLLASELNKITKQQLLLFPKLGLKMIESLKPFKNAQELYVYAKLLIANEKVSDAIAAIEQFIEKERDLELQIILLNALSASNAWEHLYKICSNFIFKDNFDDWSSWCHLIKASSHIDKLEEVLHLAKTYQPTRNAKLALLEISRYTKESSSIGYLKGYIEAYGEKSCCFSDLKSFTDLFPKDSFISAWEEAFQKRDLKTRVERGGLTNNETTFLVNYIKFQVFMTPEYLLAGEFIETALRYYNASKHLAKTKEKTDFFIGAEFILLISQAILKRSLEDGTDTLEILKCIIILEAATKSDVHEFHLRLWLVKLYSMINCFSKAKFHFAALKVRFIQNDTLSRYLLANSGLYCPTSATIEDIDAALEVYTNNEHETTYMLKEAYDKNTFSKIKGFFEFGLRLKNSITRYLNVLEGISASTIIGENALGEKYYEVLSKAYPLSIGNSERYQDLDEMFSDNRDFNILWDFGSFEKDQAISEYIWGAHRSQKFLNIMIAREAIIRKDESYSTIDGLLENIEKGATSKELTGLEKWELSLLTTCISIIQKKADFKDFDDIYSKNKTTEKLNTLDSSTIRRIFSMIRLSKTLNSIKINYKEKIDGPLNKKLALKSKSIIEDVRKQCSDLKVVHDQTIRHYKNLSIEWFNTAGAGFEIEDGFVDEVFDGIKESASRPVSFSAAL